MSTRLLFVVRRPPYGDTLSREALDALLGAAALGAPVMALFMDDGVLQWQPGQQPPKGSKNLAAMLKALPLYEIEDVFVSRACLLARGVDPDALPPEVEQLDDGQVRELLARSGQLLVSF